MLTARQSYDAALRLLAGGCSVIPVYTHTLMTPLGPAQPKRPHREALIATGHFRMTWSDKRQREERVASWLPFQTERADEATVREWVRCGVRGWGLVTGKVSGLVAIDFDLEGQSLFAALGWKAHTLTPSGGQHVFVRHPGWRVNTAKSLKEVRNAQGQLRLPPGVDVRGDGGYVVAAPTITEKGTYVRTEHRALLKRLEIPELVEHLGGSYLFRAALTLDQDPEILKAQRAEEDRMRRQQSAGALHQLGGQGQVQGMGAFDGRDASLIQILNRAIQLGQTGRNDGAFFLGQQLRDNNYTLDEALELYDTYASQVPGVDTKGNPSDFTRSEYEHASGFHCSQHSQEKTGLSLC